MSTVQICNRALSTYLGAARINSLTEATPEAEQCNLHYDDTLRSLLEAHPWRFANARQILAELTNDRPSEWAYHYARPAAALFVRWVNDAATARHMIRLGENPDAPREMTGQSIYSDVPTATCEFTRLVTDTTIFPQYFADALSAALAANIAMPITEDIRRARNAMDQAMDKLDKAMARDEQEDNFGQSQSLPSYMMQRGIER